MGCVLSSPVELIHIQRHGSAAFRCAVAEMQGWRVSHEDAHEMRCEGSSGCFWVLDGHGGDGAAIYGAPELLKEIQPSGVELPEDQRIESGFKDVDARLRQHIAKNPSADSGSTVVGCLVSRQADGSYNLKLMNCGDSRAIVVRGPTEDKASATPVPLRKPPHLVALERGDAESSDTAWPLLAETVDHKPNHPTEQARIEAAGGHVTQEEPPRLDGNLAVSRGIGDFEYKDDQSKEPDVQKVSCIPDVYELSGLRPGTICVLCCDGVWDVMTGDFVGTFVREALENDPKADLGLIAADLVRTSLKRNSRDNVTCMVVQFDDGQEYGTDCPDEMLNYEKISTDLDEEVYNQYCTFLRKCKFEKDPCVCAVCAKWFIQMNQCPCKKVYYCSKHCQKKGWKAHKPYCSAAASSALSPTNATTVGT